MMVACWPRAHCTSMQMMPHIHDPCNDAAMVLDFTRVWESPAMGQHLFGMGTSWRNTG